MASRSPYHEAADLINKIIQTSTTADSGSAHGSNHSHNPFTSSMIKNHVYEKKTGNLLCTTRSYALVCKVFEHYHILHELVQYLLVIESEQQQNQQKQPVSKEKNNKKKKKNATIIIPVVIRNHGLLYVLLFENI